jgi:hypothetical protein
MVLLTSILTKENFALHESEHQVTHTIAILLTGIEHGLNLAAI